MDTNSLINFLIPNARTWIEDQRDAHRSGGRSITSEETNSLQRYYRTKTLELARIKMVPQIENPPFYAELSRAGLPIPLDFRQMAGITFDNTILISKSYFVPQAFISLLFHELVHVVQYGCLGVPEFATRYVMGWAQNGFDYASIPLEREAYDIQIRFQQSQGIGFSVEDIIEERLNIC